MLQPVFVIIFIQQELYQYISTDILTFLDYYLGFFSGYMVVGQQFRMQYFTGILFYNSTMILNTKKDHWTLPRVETDQ